MAETITAGDAAARFEELLAEVAAGRSVVITRDGVPVARVVPEAVPPRAGRRVLTAEQEQVLAETLAFAASRPILPGGPIDRG